MKHGQIAVWAPSKIVLDAAQGPRTQPKNSPALAAWFAGEISARELVIIGEAAPATDIPLRVVSVEAGL